MTTFPWWIEDRQKHLKFLPVAKVEMGEVSLRMHQFVHFSVENLQEGSDVNEQIVHGGTVGKVGSHSVES